MKTLHEILAMGIEVKRSLKAERDSKVLSRVCLMCGKTVPRDKQYLHGNCATCYRRIDRFEKQLKLDGKPEEAAKFVARLRRNAKRLGEDEIHQIKSEARMAKSMNVG